MTQEDFDKLTEFQKMRSLLLNKVYECEKSIRKIENRCDHHYPDGRSANVTGLISSYCDICGYGA